jgi:uncharacterized surface protein with fasciclin (FAS1) repeats
MATAPSSELLAKAPSSELPTIAALAASTPQLSTLLAAVKAAGLAQTLSTEGPITVFAPTNEAWATVLTALGITPAELLSNPSVVRALLLNHVVPGDVTASDLRNGQVLTTLLGGKIAVSPAAVVCVSRGRLGQRTSQHKASPPPCPKDMPPAGRPSALPRCRSKSKTAPSR